MNVKVKYQVRGVPPSPKLRRAGKCQVGQCLALCRRYRIPDTAQLTLL